MRCGVQECIKNWVGRPTQEHRPNFRFLYPTIRIFTSRNGSAVTIGIVIPYQTWVLDSIAPGIVMCYSYYNDSFKYTEVIGRSGPNLITMKDPRLCYKAEVDPRFHQQCSIRRRYQLDYDLRLYSRDLLVSVVNCEQHTSKAYKVDVKSCEEGRTLLRKVIRQLDRKFEI